jgi:hypothetical protein
VHDGDDVHDKDLCKERQRGDVQHDGRIRPTEVRELRYTDRT